MQKRNLRHDDAARHDPLRHLGHRLRQLVPPVGDLRRHAGEGKDPLSCEAYLAQRDSNVESGTFVKGDTLEEVIAQLDGLDAEAALASVDHYNELCDAGCDTDFHKDASLMAPIKEGPFYGCKLSMSPANFPVA